MPMTFRKVRTGLLAAVSAGSILIPVAAMSNSEFGKFLAGQHAEALQDTENAASFLLHVLEENPDDQKLLRRTFVLALTGGQMELAISLARRIDESGGQMPTADLLLGVELLRQGNFEAARDRFDAMPRNGLATYSAPLALAWSLVGLQAVDQALAALAPLDKESGFDAMRDLHTALISEVAGRNAAAEAAYRKIADPLDAAPIRVVRAVAAFLERNGRAGEARNIYEGYLRRDPRSLVIRGELERLNAGGPATPLVDSPADGMAESLFNIASALPRDRAGNIAIVYARLALYLRPEFELARLLIGELMDEEKQPEIANAIYASIDQSSPYGWSARLRIADNLADLGDVDQAVSILEKMAAERMERTDALIRLGGILRSKERYAEAVGAYDRAAARFTEADSGDWFFYYNRGIALERSDLWPRAEKDFLKALELQPDQPYVMNYLGYSWAEKGMHMDRARALIEKAVELRRNDGFIVDSLGWVLYRLGDYTEAVRQLERAVRLRPSDPVINDHLGDAYWRVGRKLEARFQWQHALDLNPEESEIKKIQRKLTNGLDDENADSSGG
ncbi:MAG: tetratricopeptide repeat protein [Alphaproteobacteria bacterium]